ncbi:HNH endonuclease [Paenibacillus sp. J5C_2022]|nr:HNH endonuclease [Paenibacillus sp. J5C2022]
MNPITIQQHTESKRCATCGAMKPLGDFLRRTGRRSGRYGRRGTCRSCRRLERHVPERSLSARSGTRASARAGAERAQQAAAGGGAVAGAERAQQAAAGGGAVAGAERAQQAAAGGGAAAGAERAQQSAAGGGAVAGAERAQQAAAGGGAAAGAERAQRAAVESGAVAVAERAQRAAVESGAKLRSKPRRKRRRGGAKLNRQEAAAAPAAPMRPHMGDPRDESLLRPTHKGFIRMRGKTDKGRRWYQEIEPELARVLVREGAAVIVNPRTIRRLYSNKEFRHLILTRDNYTCRFCGEYGDTIDHVLPRAKGGHTTPMNCVCACNECNQMKASKDMDEFLNMLPSK